MITLLPDTAEVIRVPINELLSLRECHIPAAVLALRPLKEEEIYSLVLSDPANWPPVLVTHIQLGGRTKTLLIDGYHRQEAARRKGMADVAATVQSFDSENALVEAAFRANLTHGIRASGKTRSDYAYWLHLAYPDMEQKEIAERAQIKPSTVCVAIARRERQAQRTRAKDDLYRLHSAEDRRRDERLEKEQQARQRAMRAYVQRGVKLYDQIRHQESGELYWLILGATKNDTERTKMYRLSQLIQQKLQKEINDILGIPASRVRKTQAVKEEAGEEKALRSRSRKTQDTTEESEEEEMPKRRRKREV